MPDTTLLGQARPRREDEYTPGSANYYNHQYQTRGTPPPSGFEVGKSGTVSTQDSGLSRLINHPLFPLLMVGGFGGGGALAGALGAGGAGSAGAAGLAGGPGAISGLGGLGTMAGAGSATAGASGALAGLQKWLPLISAGTSLGGGIFAGKSAENARRQASGGMDFATMAPLIQALIQQQQTQSAENYAAQQAKAQQSAPLQQAIASLAMRLQPR